MRWGAAKWILPLVMVTVVLVLLPELVAYGAIISSSIVIGVLVFEFGLALFLLEKGEGRTAARLLAAFLIVHSIAFIVGHALVIVEEFDPRAMVGLWRFMTLQGGIAGLLPGLLATFVLSYPVPVVRPWIPLTATIVIVETFMVAVNGLLPTPDFVWPALGLVFALFNLAAVACSAALPWIRARRASTQLMKKRLQFIGKVTVAPIIVLPVFAIAEFAAFSSAPAVANLTGNLGFLAWTLVLPLGLAYGLLNYRILDLDLRIQKTVQRAIVGFALLAVFTLVTAAAEYAFTNQSQSALLGIAGTALVLLLLHPLQVYASRMARTMVPPPSDRRKFEEFRRWEIYRATFEEVRDDGEVTDRERRTLDSLARSLALKPQQVRVIEQGVATETRHGG